MSWMSDVTFVTKERLTDTDDPTGTEGSSNCHAEQANRPRTHDTDVLARPHVSNRGYCVHSDTERLHQGTGRKRDVFWEWEAEIFRAERASVSELDMAKYHPRTACSSARGYRDPVEWRRTA